MFAPGPSFAAAVDRSFTDLAPSNDHLMRGLDEDGFRKPVADPLSMCQRELEVSNTFCNVFDTLCRSHIGHDKVAVFQEALDITLTEHSFPKQQFAREDVMQTLVDTGLSMPKAFLPSDLRRFGNDFQPDIKPASANAGSSASFDAADLFLLGAALGFERERQLEANAKPQKEPEILAKEREKELLRQREEWRAKRYNAQQGPQPIAAP